MAIEVEIDEDVGIAILRVGGALSPSDACGLLDAVLTHPRYERGMNLLAILETGSVSTLALADVKAVAEHETARSQMLAPGFRLGIVVDSDLDYGNSRMYAGWADIIVGERETKVFRGLADARAWVSHSAGGA